MGSILTSEAVIGQAKKRFHDVHWFAALTNQKIPDYRCENQYETLPDSETRSAIEVEPVVSCYQNSNASGPRVLSQVAVFQNARVNFAIPKNCSPTVLAVELGVDKEIESLLAVATVDDLYYWDPWTVRDAFAVIGSLAYRGFPSCIVGYIFHMGCTLEARKWAFMSFPRMSATTD